MNYHEYSFSRNHNSKDTFTLKVLDWMQQFSTFVFLNSNNYPDPYGRYELLIGIGVHQAFDHVEDLPKNTWLFGHHEFPASNKEKTSDWNPCFFFQPEIVIAIPRDGTQGTLYTMHDNPESVFQQIETHVLIDVPPVFFNHFEKGQWSLSPQDYQKSVAQIQQWIKEDKCQELNLCVEYIWEEEISNPSSVYHHINQNNPCPFSFYYKKADLHAFSTSPERFFSLNQHFLRTQPIKGTIKRGQTKAEDLKLQQQLLADPKERFENETITKMVFEELNAMKSSPEVSIVKALEVHAFPTLHHLISTLEAEFEHTPSLAEVFQALFPMGSMTGDPKEEVLSFTHEIEATERGLYSGTIGYQDLSGAWDFNVVIRTLMYNEAKKKCSFHTGGAITAFTNASREWEEIQLKASFFKETLNRTYFFR